MFMYCVAIRAHVKVKQPNMVLELFAVRQQNGMEPDMFMYSAAINACGKANQPDNVRELRKVLQQMAYARHDHVQRSFSAVQDEAA